MASPVWKTTGGLLAIINERDYYSVQLLAEDADSTALTYSKIAGTLPTGIELTSAGLLRGVPTEVATRSLYTFVVRASDGTNIADRTFNLQVQGADIPVFGTSAGQLDLSDSTRTGNRWVLDGSYIEFKIEATDTDTAAGQSLFYYIQEGELPPGITMNSAGLISGTVLLTDDEAYGPIGGWDNYYAYDDVAYDPTAFSRSTSKNFEFIVGVSDGSNVATQVNSIFVYSADFWTVDNQRITLDQTELEGVPLNMSLAPNRSPVFETPSALGSFRHDNNVVIKIDVVDFDPLQGDLQYSIQTGALPSGLSIDINNGEIHGQLGTQAAVSFDYSFSVRASRLNPVTGLSVFADRNFTMTVIGEIDVGIAFTSPTALGSLIAGIPSLISIEAEAVASDRVLEYEVTQGSLPNGVTLSKDGNLIGTADLTEFTTVDANAITFDTNSLSFDRDYSFKITVNDQYQSVATTKEFTLKVSLPYGVEYGNMSAQGMLSGTDSNLFYSIAQDPNINSVENIFRPEDPAFGVRSNAEMLLIAGLEHKALATIQQQMEQNHEPKSLYFGNIKTAEAKENGVSKYEVVYVEMHDPLINNEGVSVSSEITLREGIKKPILGPLADANRITADYDTYEVTTDSGLSFSISGSKLRYANQLTADIGTFDKLFPNSVSNMRTRLKDLGQKEYVHLPLWMRTSQDTSGVPLGYKMAIVLAYVKPGKSGIVKKRITDKAIDFQKINFKIDRYRTNINLIDSGAITPDGSTTAFTINEIIHEEEIKLRINAETLNFGNQVTADNNLSPGYLTTDSQLRSADYEPQFKLTHDGSSKKTTITFTNPPSATSKIRVERLGDKYIGFKRKIKE